MNRRSEKLDNLIGYRVRVEFIDGEIRQGVLGYYDGLSTDLNDLHLKSHCYYLSVSANGCTPSHVAHISFRKSAVKSITRCAQIGVVIHGVCDEPVNKSEIMSQLKAIGVGVVSIDDI